MKKFLKISGFCMLGLVGLVVVALGIAWISGAFSTKKINITSLTIAQDSVVCDNATVMSLSEKSLEMLVVGDSDVSATITHEPTEATEKTLTVKYIHGKDVLEETPETVVAGQPFTLKFKKDSNNLPVGGEIELKFINSTRLVDYSVKILVDRPLFSSDIKFTTEDFNNVTSGSNVGKIVTPSNPNAVKNITLKTLNANAIAPKKGAVVFTNTDILQYKNKKMLYVVSGDNKKFEKANEVVTTTNLNGTIDFTYSFKALGATQNVKLMTFVHKTFAMQQDFDENWLYLALNNNLADYPIADLNAFIDKYYKYIAYGDDKEYMDANTLIDETTGGRVLLDSGDMGARLNRVMDAIFATCKQGIIISDVEIANISCKDLITYKVFANNTYNVETIGDSETNLNYLGVVLNSSTQTDIDNQLLKDSIGNLVVAPYTRFVIDDEKKVPGDYSLWDFDSDENPIVESGPKVTGLDGNEYLEFIKIHNEYDKTDEWYKFNEDYVTVRKTALADGKATWALQTLNPTNEDPKNLNTLHLIYSIESISSDGNASFKYAKSRLKIEYSTPTNFNWKDEGVGKVLLHNNPNISTSLIEQADFYTINTIGFNASNVISENALSELQYKNIRFYMVADSNKFTTEDGIEYNIFDMTGYEEVKLVSMSNNQLFKVSDKDTFYDLGANPSLTAKNITLLSEDDFASSVKIFACILQTDINGDYITYTDQRVEYRKVVASTSVKEYTVSYFAQNLYSYYEVTTEDGTKFVLSSQTGEDEKLWGIAGESVKLYISALPLDSDKNVIDNIDGEDTEKVDEDGVCNAYLNMSALKNYISLYNGTISYSLGYKQGAYRPSNGADASSFIMLQKSGIVYDETLPYIAIEISINSMDKNPVYNGGTPNEDGDDITLATKTNPLELDFIVYLVPQEGNSSVYETIPYYNLQNKAITSIKIERLANEGDGQGSGSGGNGETPPTGEEILPEPSVDPENGGGEQIPPEENPEE